MEMKKPENKVIFRPTPKTVFHQNEKICPAADFFVLVDRSYQTWNQLHKWIFETSEEIIGLREIKRPSELRGNV